MQICAYLPSHFEYNIFSHFLSVEFYKLRHFSGKDNFLQIRVYRLYHLDYFTVRKTIKGPAEWLQEDLERSKPSGLQVKKQNIFNAVGLT